MAQDNRPAGVAQLEHYSQGAMRDATVADSHGDGYGDNVTVSSSRNPGRRSMRSTGDAHQLELHPDSQSRQPGSLEEEYDGESYEDEEDEERSSSPEYDNELVN